MKELVGLTGVLSVYEYKLPHGEIPLVIVKKEIDRARLREEFGRSKGCIILTEDDIKHGRDVFGMRFLHMQKRCVYIGGEKILKDLELKHKKIRNELENSLRGLLIDLREMILLPEVHHTTHKMIAFALDRILVCIEEFAEKHHKKYELQLKDAIDHCHNHTVDHQFLQTLYKEIEELTEKIDEQ